MQLNVSTDYAIKLIIYLAKADCVVSSSKLSKAINISQRYLLQICSKLRDAGLISVTYGSNGGYRLDMNPDEINLYVIIVIMQGHIESRQQPFADTPDVRPFIYLNSAYQNIEDHLVQYLQQYTISKILANRLPYEGAFINLETKST